MIDQKSPKGQTHNVQCPSNSVILSILCLLLPVLFSLSSLIMYCCRQRQIQTVCLKYCSLYQGELRQFLLLQLDCLPVRSWDLVWTLSYLGLISNPRPFLDSSTQTTQEKYLFFVKTKNDLVWPISAILFFVSVSHLASIFWAQNWCFSESDAHYERNSSTWLCIDFWWLKNESMQAY